MLRRLLFCLAVALLGLHGAAFAQPTTDDDSELYDMLLGELAQPRGDYALASRHPELAPAHFATAQAAALADDDQTALAEARRAAEIRPEWEAPAMLEAQVLQKRSTAQAAKRLADFVAKNPQSRPGRLAYA